MTFCESFRFIAWVSIAWQNVGSKMSSHHTGPSSTANFPVLLLLQSQESKEYGCSVEKERESVWLILLKWKIGRNRPILLQLFQVSIMKSLISIHKLLLCKLQKKIARRKTDSNKPILLQLFQVRIIKCLIFVNFYYSNHEQNSETVQKDNGANYTKPKLISARLYCVPRANAS